MGNNVGDESLGFPPSPKPSPTIGERNPSSKEPKPTMVETGKSSEENEPNPTISDELEEGGEFPKPIIMIVPAGEDIVKTILDYARDRDVSILVLHASGPISEVHITNPLPPFHDCTFHGNLYMFFLTGVYTKCLSPFPPKSIPFSYFNIQFSKDDAPEVYGGLVGNTLIAAQPLQVTASLFKDHEYYESPITATNRHSSILSIPNVTAVAAAVATTNNTVHHHDFFGGGSTPSPPIDFTKVYRNNPTNPGDNR
ncbi:hypothetical protein PHAVU_008G200900 [Phaseolus vulgaris]|uniref:PPC domain-containing protein n=1 Tax=Phaseolus vulgaris TaxID=3885 RepID=V7B7C6_PHAVU|nr:hypothetical protein PHAVU_008G200900g [Phaseolus vulgaris]ESW13490.1 hypothetical protein PHAVU_008G200900g [Phaseolus vulgaris]